MYVQYFQIHRLLPRLFLYLRERVQSTGGEWELAQIESNSDGREICVKKQATGDGTGKHIQACLLKMAVRFCLIIGSFSVIMCLPALRQML